jgi:hypothetical protein
MTKPLTWKTKRVKLKDLIEYDKNPVQISERDAKELARSIGKFDHVIPYVAAAWPNDHKGLPLLDGHQRKMAELQLNKVSPDTLVDVRVPSRTLTEKEREELAIRLRKNTGQFDFDKLANFFDVPDLLEWGFTEKELQLGGIDVPVNVFVLGGSDNVAPKDRAGSSPWSRVDASGKIRCIIGDIEFGIVPKKYEKWIKKIKKNNSSFREEAQTWMEKLIR